MNCKNGCCAYDSQFNKKLAQKEKKGYLKSGPKKNTSLLIQMINNTGEELDSLLDIGGGVGAIQLEMMKNGVKNIQSVDASGHYLSIAQELATEMGLSSEVTYSHGDFVDLARDLSPADIVTLDKVICCYPDFNQLVTESVKKARKVYAIILPVSNLFVKFLHVFAHAYQVITRSDFRSYIHPVESIEAIIAANGFIKKSHKTKMGWMIAVYEKNHQ